MSEYLDGPVKSIVKYVTLIVEIYSLHLIVEIHWLIPWTCFTIGSLKHLLYFQYDFTTTINLNLAQIEFSIHFWKSPILWEFGRQSFHVTMLNGANGNAAAVFRQLPGHVDNGCYFNFTLRLGCVWMPSGLCLVQRRTWFLEQDNKNTFFF